MIQNLLVLPIPIELLSFPVTARRHDHRHGMSEAGLYTSVRRLPIAHALEPVIRVGLQIIALIEGRRIRMSGDGDVERFRSGHVQIENLVGRPPALRLGHIPPLRTALSTRRIECAASAADNRVIAVVVSKRGAEGIENLLTSERGDALERVRILADVVPREDAAI
jgi:hypothetical protein